MRTTSSICFYCRKSKMDKKGYSPIELSITINGKRIFINLPRKEKPSVFEVQTKKRKSEINDFLDTVRVQVNVVQTSLMRNGQPVTAENIREYMRTGGVVSYTVGDMFRNFIADNSPMTETTFGKYILIQNEFEKMYGRETEVQTITPNMIGRFYSHLLEVHKESTASSKMSKLKSVFRYAFENGKITTFPFNTVKITKGKPKKEYLCEGDVRKMMEKKIDIERLEKVRDILIFQMSTGLSYTDIWDVKNILEKDGIHYIKGRRRKTGIEFTAVVLPEGLSIWEKYNGVLPVISNQKLNAYAKELQDICGITQNLTSHLFRKTYATSMLNRGVAITTVSKMLGHSNSNITQRHYASVYDDTVINEVKAVI